MPKKSGFTLIELLIVIAIMGILAAAVLVAVNPAKRSGQARDAIRQRDLGQVKNSLEAYSVVYGSYLIPVVLGMGMLQGMVGTVTLDQVGILQI